MPLTRAQPSTLPPHCIQRVHFASPLAAGSTSAASDHVVSAVLALYNSGFLMFRSNFGELHLCDGCIVGRRVLEYR